MAKRLALVLVGLLGACSGGEQPAAETSAVPSEAAVASDAAAASVKAPVAVQSAEPALAKEQPVAVARPVHAAAEKPRMRSNSGSFAKKVAGDAAADSPAPAKLSDQSGSASKPR